MTDLNEIFETAEDCLRYSVISVTEHIKEIYATADTKYVYSKLNYENTDMVYDE